MNEITETTRRKRGRQKGFRLEESTKKQIALAQTGHVVSEETRKKISDGVKRTHNIVHMDRILAVDLKEATTFIQNGYVVVYIPNLDGCGTGNCMRYHTVLMEQTLGRKLTGNEDVHHIDFNKENNNIDNLVILNKSEHMNKHQNGMSKNYIITFPDGNVKKINNMYRFCVEHDLLYVAMISIANNKKYYKSHHGFSCVKAGES